MWIYIPGFVKQSNWKSPVCSLKLVVVAAFYFVIIMHPGDLENVGSKQAYVEKEWC